MRVPNNPDLTQSRRAVNLARHTAHPSRSRKNAYTPATRCWWRHSGRQADTLGPRCWPTPNQPGVGHVQAPLGADDG